MFPRLYWSDDFFLRFCGYVATFYSRRKSQAEEEGVKNLHDRNKGNKER